MRKKLFSQKEFNEIYKKVPRICVDLLFRNKDGFLLIKRTQSPYRGLYALVGGTVFIHETLNEAIKRIAKEELNIEVIPKAILGTMEFLNEGRGRHAVSIVFDVKGNPKGRFFKKIPKNTIIEHKDFLEKL